MKRGVAIVGAGHGGVQAAASLREAGYDGPLALISDEPHLPYHRPPLSKAFLKEAEPKPQLLRGETFYTTNRIEFISGRRVEALDLAAARLAFADGGHLDFDRLVLATGSRPRLPALPGIGLAGVHTLRSLDDARALKAASAAGGEAVVVGGGFIGLELAATLGRLGWRVSVVEALERLLSRAVAPALSAHVQATLAASGVALLTGERLAGVEGDKGRVRAVRLASGRRLAADLVVLGIGAVPNVELAAAAGLGAAGGIDVDAYMQSADPRVFAIGDCTLYRHWANSVEVRLESVQNATDQGRTAARNIMGAAEPYRAVPWFWSDIADMKLQMVGLPHGVDRHVVGGDPESGRFAVFGYAGKRLAVIDTVNRPADHILGRRMMAAGFSPAPEVAAAGTDALKAAFQDWERAGLGLPLRA